MTNYKIHRIDMHTWRLEDMYKTYMYLAEGEKRAVLIDSGNGFSGLEDTIASLTKKPVFVILTHGHFDHTSCASLFDQCYIHADDALLMRDSFRREIRRVQIGKTQSLYRLPVSGGEWEHLLSVQEPKNVDYLQEGQIFDLGGRYLEVINTPGHTKGSICLLDKENKYLFSGDMVCNREILIYLEESEDVETVRDQMRKLLQRRDDIVQIWPGHHECPLHTGILEDYLYASEQILTDVGIGEEIILDVGYKLLYRHKTIGISYKEDHVRKM